MGWLSKPEHVSNRPWANREPDFALSGRGSNYDFDG